jgi:uncharacterized membrane protein
MSEEFLKWFGFWGTLISLLMGLIGIYGVVITLKAWIKTQNIEKFLEEQKERENEKVQIILTDGKLEYELKPSLRRREVIRNEIQGRLGTIPLKDKKERSYRVAYLNNSEFFEQIDVIQNGSNKNGNSKLVIKCNIGKDAAGNVFDEFNQFEIADNNIKKLLDENKKHISKKTKETCMKRNILLCVAGLTPQIITEVLYTFAVQS